MRVLIATYWGKLRASYWFLPSLMALAAAGLSIATTLLDLSLGSKAAGIAWLSFNTPDGARALLSTIAGSMITVAGVTFSITIAALAYATSQLGPRLLNNFMRDTGNQVTLGTFIATFLYCLLILRTVQSGDESANLTPFVPHLGVVVAMGLAIASIGVLIYFIHHVPMSIQVSKVVAQIGEELLEKVEHLFPKQIGKAPPEGTRPVARAKAYPEDGGRPVRAKANGYLTHIGAEDLLGWACEDDFVLRLLRRPGDFVSEDETLARVYDLDPDKDEVEALDRIRGAFILARERTHDQDLLFITQQLVEIAARALSTGVNDPYTAMSCLDWLGSALTKLGGRDIPAEQRYDDEGRLRIIAPALSFDDVASAAFDQLRPYVSSDPNAALRMMGVIERIATQVTFPPYRATLREHALALLRGGEGELAQERDVTSLQAAYGRIPGIEAPA